LLGAAGRKAVTCILDNASQPLSVSRVPAVILSRFAVDLTAEDPSHCSSGERTEGFEDLDFPPPNVRIV
jgi:hypothetical protein